MCAHGTCGPSLVAAATQRFPVNTPVLSFLFCLICLVALHYSKSNSKKGLTGIAFRSRIKLLKRLCK